VDNRPIGLFDSGVGGLSLLAAAKRLLPTERYLMVADGRYFPYGAADSSWVQERAEQLSGFLLEHDAKLIVVACNTATVHALGRLRERFPQVPFVGVVPVIKTLARRTKSGTIAVLSTPATAESSYLAGLIRDFALERRVINIPCPGLAELVEVGDLRSDRARRSLAQALAGVEGSGADVLGLGCTHYLFLRRSIKQQLGPAVQVFSPARPVARRIRQVLVEKGQLAQESPGKDLFFTTGEPRRFGDAARRLLRRPIGEVAGVDL
jgi:glutamate racemase